jgi:hypothetical protein
VALCDLVAARGDADVEAAVLRAVGAPATSPRPSAAIEAALAEAPDALLLFDNAESALVETARMVELCLDLSPSLRVLVTSRAPLQIAGESRLPLFGLDPEAAGALLRARAEAALDDAAADAVLRRLDGIPLAVELAAARTALVGPGALASLLREQQSGAGWLRVLSDPSAPERQGAMLGVLEGPHERRSPASPSPRTASPSRRPRPSSGGPSRPGAPPRSTPSCAPACCGGRARGGWRCCPP